MLANFVVRLLDADHNLVAWSKVQAKAYPAEVPGRSSQWWPAVLVTEFIAEAPGTITQMYIEWADCGLGRVAPIGPLVVDRAGRSVKLEWSFINTGPIWMVRDERTPEQLAVVLTPIVEREPVRIGVPAVSLGTRDPRM